MWQGMDVVASIRWLGPLVFHAAAKDAMITPGVDIRGVLDTSFERVPADAEGKVPTGYGFGATPAANPAWRFVAVGIGHESPTGPNSSPHSPTSTPTSPSTSSTRTPTTPASTASPSPQRT